VANAPSSESPLRPFLVLGSLILAVAALYWAQKVLIPVALAVLLSFILTPAVTFLQRRGLKRVFAVVLVLLLAFGLLAGLGYVLAVQVGELSQQMASHSANISRKIAALRESQPGAVSNFLKVFEEVGGAIGRLTSRGKAADADVPPVPVEVARCRCAWPCWAVTSRTWNSSRCCWATSRSWT
jgi:predicted PurR-regulated permease PerM